ncbi:extracellular calcium-sensing receptor-like [Periophthalmus magnuspinnatus]|uniref:extracellular calcium-sensing receptor-like n=1 Tax=Periophthalmus magnuspinnatus TaxID=409849 RepID=UPI0024370669|nr:extracellular calcium-sensing receptor-like [Periophthalmus magnuspinnatus]
MIGGIFPVYNKEIFNASRFPSEPAAATCTGFNLRVFRWTQVMIFAIEEVNRSLLLLPNVTVGYMILNSCSSPSTALKAALAMAGGVGRTQPPACTPAVSALIAESGSSQSIAVAGTLGPFQVPVVSYFSTCACLSDRAKFPSFFRTIPSDYFQAKALAALVKHFNWHWIGAVQSDDDYGRNGVSAFIQEAKKLGVCVAFVGTVLRTYSMDKILKVVDMIKMSSVKVVLGFAPEGDMYPLMLEIVKQNITGIQWLASEAWITAAVPSTPEMYPSFGGALGFVMHKRAIPKLKSFLTDINPYASPEAAFVKEFWEDVIGCTPNINGVTEEYEPTKKLCTGKETLKDSDHVFFDVTQLRASYNVYNAVYAVAHALHQLLFCQAALNQTFKQCKKVSEISPKLVTENLKKVNFQNMFGDDIFFDANGNPPPSYDLINWQMSEGKVQHVTVGHFLSAKGDYKLRVNEKDIIWKTEQTVPKSVCSTLCPVGTRKAQIKGKPVCCFDCIPCAEGTIANKTGEVECTPCPEEYWSNSLKNACIPKTMEYLSYQEPMGIALTFVSLMGTALSMATMLIFILYRDTPVIKASNTELSCFLLFSLFLCFLCPLTFIGKPTMWTCMLRHTAFGVTFAFCMSCVLGRTIVVVAAFKAIFPGNSTAVKFGHAQQRIIVGSCTLVQILLCAAWLNISPPFPDRVFKYSNTKIVLECNTGSQPAFCAVLGYIGLLAITCLVLAFLARKLPDNFNEAKFITFSMLIFCAVWIAFIPAYVSSPGKFTVAVEIFAILSSAFGLLISIFAPKCYIILIKPEKNTKKYMMRKI